MLLGTIVPMVVVIGIVLSMDYQNRSEAAQNDLEERTRAVVAALHHDVARMIFYPDRELSLDITQRLKSFPYIESLHVYKKDGQIVFSYENEGWAGEPAPPIPRTYGTDLSSERLQLSSKVGEFATVFARSDVRSIQSAKSAALRMSLQLGLILVFACGFSAIALQRRVARRLVQLENTAKRVVQTRDYTLRAEDQGSDELGLVARTLNNLLSTVEDNMRTLKEREQRLLSETERRTKAQEEVARVERQLYESQKLESMGRLAGGVAHDFNNLLTVIGNQSEMILEEHPESGADLIADASARAAELTNQLLSLSKKASVDLRSVEVSTLLEEVERLLARVIPSNVTIHLDFDPALWNARADAGRLQQVILNLAINARDAMPDGGVLALSARNLETESGGDQAELVQIRVVDTGYGMSSHTRDRALEPFFTTKGEGGSGLGLAVAYGIVQQFEGTLFIESSEGRGTSVEVRIPRSINDEIKTDVYENRSTSASGSGTILLVEDENMVRIIAERSLVRAGYRVLSASNGEVGLGQWEANRTQINLLVTDMMMPEMNGLQLARKLRRERPELPILMISGYTGDESFEEFMEDPHFSFLAKPYKSADLVDATQCLLTASQESARDGRGELGSGSGSDVGEKAKLYRIRP